MNGVTNHGDPHNLRPEPHAKSDADFQDPSLGDAQVHIHPQAHGSQEHHTKVNRSQEHRTQVNRP